MTNKTINAQMLDTLDVILTKILRNFKDEFDVTSKSFRHCQRAQSRLQLVSVDS